MRRRFLTKDANERLGLAIQAAFSEIAHKIKGADAAYRDVWDFAKKFLGRRFTDEELRRDLKVRILRYTHHEILEEEENLLVDRCFKATMRFL